MWKSLILLSFYSSKVGLYSSLPVKPDFTLLGPKVMTFGVKVILFLVTTPSHANTTVRLSSNWMRAAFPSRHFPNHYALTAALHAVWSAIGPILPQNRFLLALVSPSPATMRHKMALLLTSPCLIYLHSSLILLPTRLTINQLNM